MNIQLVGASVQHTFCMEHLMQFYLYDFSEYMDLDVMKNGLFREYDKLESYWLEKDKFAYLLVQEEKYVGFVLVKRSGFDNSPCFSIAEFFVLKRYRNKGIGRSAALQVFEKHKGCWHVSQLINNQPARAFWRKVIAAYTLGKFSEHCMDEKVIQRFDNLVKPLPAIV